MSPILVIGAGSWGTALSVVLSNNGHKVYLWGHDAKRLAVLRDDGRNQRYLPDVDLPDTLYLEDDLQHGLQCCDELVIAIPYAALRTTLNAIRKTTNKNLKLCLTSKGIETHTHYVGTQVVADCLGDKVHAAVLSGPSFAKDVAMGLPTSVTVAGTDTATVQLFADRFHSHCFRIYTHDDVIGVQIGGATKNIMAIAAGISDGLALGANARAALICRGLAEIVRFGVIMGARTETFMGLTGLGDLVLTCTDDKSRNRRFGFALAQGMALADIHKNIGQAIEGIDAVSEVSQIALERNIEMPITQQICKVLAGSVSPRDALSVLLAREKKQELDGDIASI